MSVVKGHVQRHNDLARAHPRALHRSLSTLASCGLAPVHVVHALQLWHRLCADYSPPEPSIDATDAAILFAWRNGSQYLDVEVYESGSFAWFYDDSAKQILDGSDDDPVTTLPPSFFDRLVALSGVDQ